MDVCGQHLAPSTLPQGREPPIHGTGTWASTRAGLDDFETQTIPCPWWDSNPWPSSPKPTYTDHSEIHKCTSCLGTAANNELKTLNSILVSACAGFIAHILRHMNLFLDAFYSCCFPPACHSMSLLPCSADIRFPQITDSQSHDCTPETQRCHQSLGTSLNKGLFKMRSLWFEECQTRQIDGQILALAPTSMYVKFWLHAAVFIGTTIRLSVHRRSWNNRKSTYQKLLASVFMSNVFWKKKKDYIWTNNSSLISKRKAAILSQWRAVKATRWHVTLYCHSTCVE